MINDFVLATEKENNIFRAQYCKNQYMRHSIPKRFQIEVDVYEDLAPGQAVYSWICGGKKIRNAVMTFKVRDKHDMKLYYPVFPASMGEEMLKYWDMPLPVKWSVYAEQVYWDGQYRFGALPISESVERLNQQMRNLLIYARLFVAMQHSCSYPMPYGFKEIFGQLQKYPEQGVDGSVVAMVNSVISQHLAATGRIFNCKHLQEFVTYLHNRYPKLRFIDCDFSALRESLHEEAPFMQCYF